MKGIRSFIAMGFLLLALIVASAALATDATITAVPTGSNTVEVKDCGYATTGITVTFTRPGSIGTTARGSTKPGGCFDVHGFVAASGTWNVKAFDTSGNIAHTTVTVP